MDLLKSEHELDLYDGKWRIRTRNKHIPPQYIAATAKVKNTIINEGCVIEGTLNNCVLSTEIHVEEGAYMENCVILSKVIVKPGAKIFNAIIMEDVVIEENTVIGSFEADKVFLVTKEQVVTE